MEAAAPDGEQAARGPAPASAKRTSEGGPEDEQPETKKPRVSAAAAAAAPRAEPEFVVHDDDDDADLARAIALSLEGSGGAGAAADARSSSGASAPAQAAAAAAAASPSAAAAAAAAPAGAATAASAPAASAAASSGDSDAITCPVCWDPVACAAQPPCGHMLCRVCAQQLLRDGGARCPQCRAEVAEAALQGSPAADTAAAALAKSTLDAEGLAEWQQRLADGKALAARAASAASASSDGDRGASAAKVDAELRFMASAAPTGSGKCKICAEKIAKRDTRLHAHGGFIHLGCTDFAGELARAREKARKTAGVPDAEVVLTVLTTPEFHGPCCLSEEQLVALKQKLREPAGSQPWWCVVRHKGSLWADEADEDDLPSDDDDLDDDDSDSDSDSDEDDDDDDDDGGDGGGAPSSAHIDQLTRGGSPARISMSLTVSAAPTDRARCAGCGEAIPRGSPRLHEATGTGFRHWHCRDFQQEWTAAGEAARQRQGDSGTVWLEIRSNVDPAGIGGLDRSMVQLLKQILRSTAELMPSWMWVRHRGTLWESNYGTPRAGAGAGAGLHVGAAAAAAAPLGAAGSDAAARGQTENEEDLFGQLFGGTGASGSDASVDGHPRSGGLAHQLARGGLSAPEARAAMREMIEATVHQRADRGAAAAGGGGARSDTAHGSDSGDDSADDEDSSDESAIAQAGRLGAALGGMDLSGVLAQYLAGGHADHDEMDDDDSEDDEDLEDDDRHGAGASEPWGKVNLSYTTSAAPSDRGKCKVCGQAIAQGSVVFAERQGGGSCHLGCKDFFKELSDACHKARAGPSQERYVAQCAATEPAAAATGATAAAAAAAAADGAAASSTGAAAEAPAAAAAAGAAATAAAAAEAPAARLPDDGTFNVHNTHVKQLDTRAARHASGDIELREVSLTVTADIESRSDTVSVREPPCP
jgi:hypothetical protein